MRIQSAGGIGLAVFDGETEIRGDGLQFIGQGVVVAALAEMDKASCSGEEIEGALAFGVELRRGAAFAHGANLFSPLSSEMRSSQQAVWKSRRPPGEFFRLGSRWKTVSPYLAWRWRVSSARFSRRAARLRADHAGENVIAKFGEERLVTGEIAAIEKRNIELGIFALEFGAFGERASGRADAHAHIPEHLAEFSRSGLDALFGGAIGAEKKQIDIGVGEKFAAAIATESDEREFGAGIGLVREKVAEKFDGDLVDERGALFGDRAAVAGRVEVLLNFCGLGCIRLAQKLARS